MKPRRKKAKPVRGLTKAQIRAISSVLPKAAPRPTRSSSLTDGIVQGAVTGAALGALASVIGVESTSPFIQAISACFPGYREADNKAAVQAARTHFQALLDQWPVDLQKVPEEASTALALLSIGSASRLEQPILCPACSGRHSDLELLLHCLSTDTRFKPTPEEKESCNRSKAATS